MALMKFLDQQAKQLRSLSEQYPQLWEVHEEIIDTYSRVPEFWEHNEQLLYHLLTPFSFRYCLDLSSGENCGNGFELLDHNDSKADHHVSYESITQVLHHLMRDYSERAEETRRKLYTPILSYLSQHLPAEE